MEAAILSLLVAVSAVSGVAIVAALVCAFFSPRIAGLPELLIAAAALIAATLVGWPATEAVLQLASLKTPPRQAPLELPATAWVGIMERFGFTLAVIMGYPEIAALIVGVKALGTYATFSGRSNTTPAARVLGTLTSITAALLVASVFIIARR